MIRLIAAVVLLAGATAAHGAEATVALDFVGAVGKASPAGTVRVVETRHGLVFYPALTGLPPGLHGFHVHEKPSCAAGMRDGKSVAALAAGDHLDPSATKRHGEPWGNGHLGDLPALHVGADGKASNPVLAPRLKLKDVANRSLMIHAGGDNHADHPAALGGGGARIACGVFSG